MKKKLSYRDKLVELAYIYDVKEIKDYEKSRKNLTSGQLELILKKHKITIPKDFKSNFLRDNILKPVGKIKSNLIEYKENKIKDSKLFHAGTKYENETVLTSGGRVFCATALGSDLKDAQKNAYNLVNNVEFDGAFFRKDIGFKGIKWAF